MGGLLGGIDLHLPFFVAGGLALLNLVYGYFVLPESLPVERRRAFDWARANPLSSLVQLAQLKGVGRLVAVLAFAGLAQFTLYTTWVLYTTFKFGWGPTENGWSLFAVGMVSALVQGVLLGRLLKRVPAAAPGGHGPGVVDAGLRRLRPRHRGLDDVRGDRRQPAGQHRGRVDAEPDLQRRRRQRTGPDDGRGERR